MSAADGSKSLPKLLLPWALRQVSGHRYRTIKYPHCICSTTVKGLASKENPETELRSVYARGHCKYFLPFKGRDNAKQF